MKLFTLFFAIFLSIAAKSESLVPPQGGVLEINPSPIIFNNFDPLTITVNNNYYLKKSEIKSVQLVIEKENGRLSDYSWMIRSVIQNDGSITIHPYKLEIGTYSLIVKTDFGKVSAPVQAVLVDPPVRDISPGEPTGRYKTIINLSENYFYGQNVVINLDVPAGEVYEWTVNGETFTQNADKLVYLPSKIGPYTISLKATKNGAEVSSWSGSFNVIEEPTIELQYKLGQKVRFNASENYELNSCTINENAVACEGTEFVTEKFTKKGEYSIVLYLNSTLENSPMPVRMLTYRIIIQ